MDARYSSASVDLMKPPLPTLVTDGGFAPASVLTARQVNFLGIVPQLQVHRFSELDFGLIGYQIQVIHVEVLTNCGICDSSSNGKLLLLVLIIPEQG